MFFLRTAQTWLARQRLSVFRKLRQGKTTVFTHGVISLMCRNRKCQVSRTIDNECLNVIIRFHGLISKSRVGNARENYTSNSRCTCHVSVVKNSVSSPPSPLHTLDHLFVVTIIVCGMGPTNDHVYDGLTTG